MQRSSVRQVLSVSDPSVPAAPWRTWATRLQRDAAAAIMSRRDELSWLADRGIDAAAVKRFGLGWLPGNTRVDRSSIGLPPRDDGKAHLWVPSGLVIPIAMDGRLHRLRIRRPPAERSRFLPDLKYVWIEGSGTGPMQIGPSSGRVRGAVIVEAELDAIAIASAHQDVLVVALGSVSAGITTALSERLATCPVILVSLDADGQTDGCQGAGPRAVSAWKSSYRQARFWPVPSGKDPGEYVAAGGSIHDWIEAGLPPVVTNEETSSPGIIRQGESGAAHDHGPDDEADATVWYEMDVAGRTICLTDDRETWMRLADDGRIVFSANELRRLGHACAGLDSDEADQLRSRVMDLKEIFGPAYIYRGGECQP